MQMDYLVMNLVFQVLLDVVFNHTAEGNERGPIFSFRGLDNSVYYMIAPKVPWEFYFWAITQGTYTDRFFFSHGSIGICPDFMIYVEAINFLKWKCPLSIFYWT